MRPAAKLVGAVLLLLACASSQITMGNGATGSVRTSGTTGKFTVNGNTSPIATITIAIDPTFGASILVGGTSELEATAVLQDGTTVDCTATCAWATTDATIASLGSQGDPQVVNGVAAGTANISCSASGITSNSIAITVTTPSTLSITTTSVRQATVGSAYTSLAFVAIGGTGPYTWACNPACSNLTGIGLSLSAAGVISGTPAGGSNTSSPYPFTVQATDSIANVVSAPFSLKVILPNSTCNPLTYICPELPRVFMTTTYSLPVGGTTWAAHTAAQLTSALGTSAPGDVIVLDAGVTYSGTFTLPAKPNPSNKWIYITSSAYASLPAPGTRVAPTDTPNMPRLTTTSAVPPISVPEGGNHYRLVGLEITSNSTSGCHPTATPPVNCFSYDGVSIGGTPGISISTNLPDSIFIDRCYIHGTDTQDIRDGVLGNGSNIAVIDSYISDIHESIFDSDGFNSYASPGPIKIVNNYISATTEDIMFGGAGGVNNLYVSSDIEVRDNHLFKPLAWEAVGITIPPKNKWVTKDNFEIKSGQRVLVDHNVMENNWKSGQLGSGVLFTVRSGQSGDIAVVDDVTFTNNLVKNVNQGFSTLDSDYTCGKDYPLCKNKGESRRIWAYNNLVLLKNPAEVGYSANPGLVSMAIDVHDKIFQHNTVVPFSGATCNQSVFFQVLQGTPWPPPPTYSASHGIWILDNALCRQPTGDNGAKGTTGIGYYMGDPSPLAPRYLGNVMFAPTGETVQTWPPHNLATATAFTYVSPGTGNYQLSIPNWTDTSDGLISGIQNATIAH